MDWNAVGVQAILALVPVVTMLLVYGIRKLLPKLPKYIVPLIALGLGAFLTWLQGYMGGVSASPLVMVLLGAAATWLHEVINALKGEPA